jgi:hypothetical protein
MIVTRIILVYRVLADQQKKGSKASLQRKGKVPASLIAEFTN